MPFYPKRVNKSTVKKLKKKESEKNCKTFVVLLSH